MIDYSKNLIYLTNGILAIASYLANGIQCHQMYVWLTFFNSVKCSSYTTLASLVCTMLGQWAINNMQLNYCATI